MQNNYYDNRELSWLKFNMRVLEEARDPSVPLFERLSFAAIFQSNLDEFFMVRVGSITDQMLVSPNFKENKTYMSCKEQLDAIFQKVHQMTAVRDSAYNNIIKELKEYGMQQITFKDISKEEEQYLKAYFINEIMPLTSPQIIDKRHPFPFFKNKEIYAVAHLESKNKSQVKIGVIPASGIFDRIIYLPSDKKKFILVEELILHYISEVFVNYKIINKTLMRITRNADINAEEALYDHDVDFRDTMAELIKKRKKLSPVRIEFTRYLTEEAVEFLLEKLELKSHQIFYTKSPLDLSFVYTIRENFEFNEKLFFKKLTPQMSKYIDYNISMTEQIKKKDLLLSYPYESIKPFIRLLNESAKDPHVINVKITLYRVAKDSKIVEALVDMAENGKDVVVLVELRARFDEENNIGWSKRLEEAGCTVIYGLPALKVHSKLLLITRKVGKNIEYITQIGTGNYNEKTSTLYTDLSLMTASKEIGLNALSVFNALCTQTCVEDSKHLLVAPLCLQNKILELLDTEILKAKNGEEAYFGAKLNSLTDKVIIEKLIEASQAGVKIDLVIRGICCLICGVEGFTDNVSVRSIVGRFLEHSRIYIFGKGETQKIFISSADFMTRNTIRRVEVAAPVYDEDIKRRIIDMFNIMLQDNIKARVQNPDGSYSKCIAVDNYINSQQYFYNEAYKNAAEIKEEKPGYFTKIINKAKSFLKK